jgi:pantetheine-phosphate adenylyltransferase
MNQEHVSKGMDGARASGIRRAVFPATFDPITNGHVALVERAMTVFDELILGVYDHPPEGAKRPLFDTQERVALARAATGHLPGVSVRPFAGLAVRFAHETDAQAIVRGLRVADDFEFERKMAMMNRHLASDVETLLLIADPEHAFVSASIVREVALMDGDVRNLVPRAVAKALEAKRAAASSRPERAVHARD